MVEDSPLGGSGHRRLYFTFIHSFIAIVGAAGVGAAAVEAATVGTAAVGAAAVGAAAVGAAAVAVTASVSSPRRLINCILYFLNY